MSYGGLRVLADPQALARAASEEFYRIGSEALAARNSFAVALAGGNTPRVAYREIATAAGQSPRAFDWSRTYFFWGDERLVPPDDPQSNYRMARETLLARIPVPDDNVFPVLTQQGDARRDAEAYERTVRDFFEREGRSDPPRFDLIFLGLGEDGHIASLFPGSDALEVTNRLVVATRVEKLGSWRITMTLPVLNNASNVIVLVSGKEKAETLRTVIEGPQSAPPLPAQRLKPTSGSLLWLADSDAAPWAGETPTP